MASFFSGASEEVQRTCGAYGQMTGRAFQIADDILDLIGDETRVGKSLGTDWDRGKMTLPLIRLRNVLPENLLSEVRSHFGQHSTRSILMEDVFSPFLKVAISETQAEIKAALQQACDFISCLPNREGREPLIALTHFLGSRNY